jgi:hypothetical protein
LIVLLESANAPVAVLEGPVVLLKSAPMPVTVFPSAVLARSVPAPMAVLKLVSEDELFGFSPRVFKSGL